MLFNRSEKHALGVSQEVAGLPNGSGVRILRPGGKKRDTKPRRDITPL